MYKRYNGFLLFISQDEKESLKQVYLWYIFPGRRLRALFTKSCNEMGRPYWLLYSTNQ
jgi:hypothetical protein